jgi:hypothetical protein
MPVQDEVDVGLAMIRETVERRETLRLTSRRLDSRLAQYFVVSAGQKAVDFVLSHEFVSDLPNTKSYRAFLNEYVSELEMRFEQPNPLDFYCRSGTALNVTIKWPITPISNRDASFVHVEVQDIRMPTLVAKCSLIFVYPVGPSASRNPFQRQQAIVNRIRQGIDRQEVAFYARAAHPHELQMLEIWPNEEPAPSTEPVPSINQTDLEQYLSGKVYWLAFKRADRNAKVWIADKWDATYLGIEAQALRQAAQIQDARGVLKLDKQDFAGPGDALLVGNAAFEVQPRYTPRMVFFSGSGKSAQFIRNMLRQILPEHLTIVTSAEQQPSSKIGSDVRSLIERADYVVLDVGDESPNIFFEMGIVQALKKKLVLLVPRQQTLKLPLDVGGVLYLPYDDKENFPGLKESLSNYIERYWGLPVVR